MCLLLLVPHAPARALDLTTPERDWIKSHGPVKVLVGTQQEPYFRSSAVDQRPQGFAIEAFELLAARAGLEWQYVKVGTLSEGVEMLRQGHADMAAFLRLSPERNAFLVSPGPLLPVDTVLVTRKDASDLPMKDGLAGRRVGVVAGSVNEEHLQHAYPRAQVERFATQQELIGAVAAGSLETAMSELHVAIYLIEANLFGNLQVRRVPTLAQDAYGQAVRRDLPILLRILVKARDSMTSAELAELARRWLPSGANTGFDQQTVELSDAERDWTTRHGEIKAGFDDSFVPFSRVGALGTFEGLGADVLRAAATKAGLRVASQQGGSFAAILALTRSDEVNVVVGMAGNAQRPTDFHFIGPWATAPTVVVTRLDRGLLGGDLESLHGGQLAVLREHFLLPELQLRLPGLRTRQYGTQREALQAVADGQAEAAIGNGYVVNLLINERFTGHLRVTGVVRNGDSELYFGVPRRHSELARMLGRGFAALSPAERAEIQQRWLLVHIEPGVPWRDVLRWGAPSALALLAIVLTLLLVNRRLRQARKRADAARAQAVEATAARGRFLAYLAHELRGGIGGMGSGARMLLNPSHGLPQRDLLAAMAQSADQIGELLETTLRDEVDYARGLELQPAPLDLARWWSDTLAPHRLRAQAKGLTFTDKAPRGWALADAARLGQVLANVVSNAIKFTNAGSVQARAEWTGGPRGLLRIEVLDDGPGLSDDDRRRIFEPYAQGQAGKALGQGVGLGLAIAQRIVQTMGGRIEARPRENNGSCFVIEVPLPATDAAHTGPG